MLFFSSCRQQFIVYFKMNLVKYIISAYLCHFFKPISSFLNQDEWALSFDLIKHLKIRTCVFVGNSDVKNAILHTFKIFSTKELFVTYLNYNQFVGYIDGFNDSYFNTAFVFKEKNLDRFGDITEEFKKVNETQSLINFKMLIFVENFSRKQEECDDIFIHYDCEFLVIQKQRLHRYTMTEIYTGRDRCLFSDFGIWDLSFGLQMVNIGFYQRRKKLHRIRLKALYAEGLVTFTEEKENLILREIREILDDLAIVTNVTIYRVTISMSTPPEERDKIAAGYDILENTIPMVVSTEEFLGPLFETLINWYIKYPRIELRPDYYIQPFTTDLWLGLSLLIVIGSVLTIIMGNLKRNQNKSRNFIDNLFLGLESFCNQCGNPKIENILLRSVCILLRVAALMLSTLYGGVILSFLSMENHNSPFDNLKQFAENGQYKLLVKNHSLVQAYLQKMDWSAQIYEEFKEVYDMNLDDIVKKICYKKSAAYYASNDIYKLQIPCRIFRIPEPLTVFPSGLVLKNQRPIYRIFNRQFLRFIETGIQDHIERIIWPNGFQAIEEQEYRAVEIKQMYQVILFPVIGVLLAIIICCMEVMYKRYSKVRKKVGPSPIRFNLQPIKRIRVVNKFEIFTLPPVDAGSFKELDDFFIYQKMKRT